VTTPPTEVIEAAPRASYRSPADVLRLVVAVVLALAMLLLDWLAGDAFVSFTARLTGGLAAIPTWILDIVVIGARVLAIVLFVVGVVAVARRADWRLGATVLAAAVVGALVTALLDGTGASAVQPVAAIHDSLGLLSGARFPGATILGGAAAAVTAAAPWLDRSWRRTGWTLVLMLAVARFIVAPISFDTAEAVLLGWVIGAAAVVLLGGPSRRPRGRAIAAGLAAVGVPLARLEQASLDARGSTPYFAVGSDGGQLFVKALGADERSADLLFRIYRMLLRHDLGDERPFYSLRRAVEHEAMVALAAREAGVHTPRVVAMASAEPNAFVLAYEAVDGKSLDRVDAAAVTDAVVAAVWSQVRLMRVRRIAHRDLRLANIFLAADGVVWMIDFGFSEVAASDLLLRNDLAELVASSSLQVGVERATALALAAMGPDALAGALTRLHPWALSGATRTTMRDRPGSLEAVRSAVAAACGVEAR
jgi:undecaprenyl-diphosphatase